MPAEYSRAPIRDRFWTVSPLDFRYYGGDREFFDRLHSYVSEEAFVKYQLRVEAGLAEVLASPNWQICTVAQSKEIIQACNKVSASEVYEEEQRIHHAVRALVNCIQKKVEHPARGYVHLFATSNDITDTATALRLKDLVINILMPDLIDLERLLIELTRRHGGTPQIGRTHGKHAEPITFGFALSVFVSRLLERIEKIIACANNLKGKFSGAVGAYSALSLAARRDPTLFEEELLSKLGLKPGRISTQIVEPEYVSDLAYAIISCFSILANIADDFRHLSRTEIAEVVQPYEVNDIGSSTMPHKANPQDFEQVKSMWKAMMPRMLTVFMDQISEHQRDLTNSSSGRFLIELFVAFDYSVTKLTSTLNNIEVDASKMKSNLELSRNDILSEPLYILLALKGQPDAYDYVRRLIGESESGNLRLPDLIWTEPSIKAILAQFTAQELEILRDPTKYLGIAQEKAISVANEAEARLSAIFSPYMPGGIDQTTLNRFRIERQPSYNYPRRDRKEIVAEA